MGVFLFDKIIFGPVKSRRLGVSLGINVLPVDSKVCSYNCIYCECGWNPDAETTKIYLPSRIEIKEALQKQLEFMRKENQPLDVITFAGNGEPTMHPDFQGIIDDTIKIRNLYFPNVKIAVLSNASLIQQTGVKESLLKIEMRVLKLDSAFEETIRNLNQPGDGFSLQQLINNLSEFKGQFILQTMFIKGKYKGIEIDNTTEEQIVAWLDIVKTLNPELVMIYTIARDTPADNLIKIDAEFLDEIAAKVNKLGIATQVSY